MNGFLWQWSGRIEMISILDLEMYQIHYGQEDSVLDSMDYNLMWNLSKFLELSLVVNLWW